MYLKETKEQRDPRSSTSSRDSCGKVASSGAYYDKSIVQSQCNLRELVSYKRKSTKAAPDPSSQVRSFVFELW